MKMRTYLINISNQKRETEMKRNLYLVLSLCFAMALFSCENSDKGSLTFDQDLSNAPAGTLIPGQYIVVLDNSFAKASAAAAAEMAPEYDMEIGYTWDVVNAFSAKVPADKIDALKADRRVKYVEQDQVFRIPDLAVEESMSKATAQTTPWGITRIGGSASGVGKTAWIIDSGIDLDHPDLTVDVARSKNYTKEKNADDANGHGTHCAGIVAAKNNTVGTIGVAAGATVVAVKVLDRRGSGTTTSVMNGVNYVASVAANGDAANISIGGGISTTLDNAVIALAQKGVKVAVAAGNESQNANNCSPARANHANIYTVSAIDNADLFAYFSNYANPPVDYAAPGVNILSLYKGGGTATMSGTSMAAPHVCGILLLGNVTTSGYAINDPDGNADPIAHR